MRIFVDIDGTLTNSPESPWGEPRQDMIQKVKCLALREDVELVLWSGTGSEYAKEFAAKYDIQAFACLGKPHLLVDDNPYIRPLGSMPILSPGDFLKKDFDGARP
ncbi:MAG: hypothetical protein HQL31_04090 [Planctomycetes bacterium]|nr:hypothetical protein [Planctomycetota bacterium]